MKNNLKHISIIMDGNGRWAKERLRPRVWGHVKGTSVVSTIVECASNLNLKALTLYAFSTENWSRPISEITILFKLLKKYLITERQKIIKNQICFRVIGDISALPEITKDLIINLEEETRFNPGLKLTFAFGYGGQNEIVTAVNNFINKNPGKRISRDEISCNLLAPELGEVDLVIRTGGDQRISNFLLWQSAYAEFYFTKTQWPEFNAKEFVEILESVSCRERRFGNIAMINDLQNNVEFAQSNKLNFNRVKNV